MSRTPDSASAKALGKLGAELIYGDMNAPSTLAPAVAGVDSVFSVQDFYAPNAGYEGEIRQGTNLVAAAKEAGVAHFVQSTMANAPDSQAVCHFQSKFAVERVVAASGLAYTFIGTVWFMDNLLNRKMGGLMSFPFITGALSRGTEMEMLAVDDVGAIVARVLENTGPFKGKKLSIAGDRMTVSQMKETFRQQTGKRPPPLFIPRWLGKRLSPDFASQLAWQETQGWSFSLEPAKSAWPGMRTFSQFLHEHKADFK